MMLLAPIAAALAVAAADAEPPPSPPRPEPPASVAPAEPPLSPAAPDSHAESLPTPGAAPAPSEPPPAPPAAPPADPTRHVDPAAPPQDLPAAQGDGGASDGGASVEPERRAPPGLAEPPPPPPMRPRPGREPTLLLGASAIDLMGLGATGGQLRFAAAARAPQGLPGSHPLVALDLFIGETKAGLAIRSGSLGAELWTDPTNRVRAGIGLDMGVVAYRRATNGEWSGLLTVGVRGGVEVALLRFRAGAIVIGAHAAARLGEWLSASASAGFRFGAAPRPPPRDQATR